MLSKTNGGSQPENGRRLIDLWSQELPKTSDSDLAEHIERFNKMVYDLADKEDPTLKAVVIRGL